VAHFADDTGGIELVWFTGAQWILKKLKLGVEYVVFGKPNLFNRKFNLAHPEVEPVTDSNGNEAGLHPVYPTTEKLKARFLDSKAISKLQKSFYPLRQIIFLRLCPRH
jgi:ATP-dependent DNA helicase RecG